MGLQDYQTQIKALQDQMNHYAQLLAQPVPSPVNPPTQSPVLTVDSIEAMIRKVLKEQKVEVAASPEPTEVVPETDSMSYLARLMAGIGSGLTEEQQTWLSQPSNQERLPDFFNTKDGQAFIKRFFLFYKAFVEGK